MRRGTLYYALVITSKDLRELLRRRAAFVMSMIFPMLMMALFGYMFPNPSSFHGIPIGLVNEDKGILGIMTQNLLLNLAENDSSMVIVRYKSYEGVKRAIIRGEVKAAIVIPSNFTSSLLSGHRAKLIAVLDPTSPAVTQFLYGKLKVVAKIESLGFVSQVLNGLKARTGIKLSPDYLMEPISVAAEPIVEGDYFDFIAPGFIAMTAMFSGLTIIGAWLVREREVGTLVGLMVAPIPRSSIILGKVLSTMVRNLIQAAIAIILAVILFNVHIHGSPSLITLTIVLGAFSFLGMGALAAAAAPEQETAQIALAILQFPMMFLGGVLFPVEQLPSWLQWVSRLMPLTYAADALRRVMVYGAALSDVALNLCLLCALGVISILVAVPLFDRSSRR